MNLDTMLQLTRYGLEQQGQTLIDSDFQTAQGVIKDEELSSPLEIDEHREETEVALHLVLETPQLLFEEHLSLLLEIEYHDET